ncbi:MAG: glycosyl hydrolase [Bacteroidota bacterium]
MSSQVLSVVFTSILFFANPDLCKKHPDSCSFPSLDRPLAKFEPEGNQVLVFIGQDLVSIGGMKDYKNGYLDHFPIPAGFTLYTSLANNPGSKSLIGLVETANFGNGPTNVDQIVWDTQFKNTALSLGLSMVNLEDQVAKGKLDDNIKKLGDYLLSLGSRPVFLRIGYEFDGYSWNQYEREDWLKAYKRIKDKLDRRGVNNVAYVWQSAGWVSNLEQLEAWYPGDEYVDWCAYSFFNRWRESRMIEFARAKQKPVFIAEATPTISDFTAKFDGKTKETILSKSKQAEEAWNKWFVPFFKTIEENEDVVKAIHYINCNWKERRLWTNNPTFQNIDARIQTSKSISTKWAEKMKMPKYLQASDGLFEKMRIVRK